MRVTAFLVLATLALTHAYGFGGSEEKFIKKYAMMKVYESCFGLQVLKEVRKEMKEAAQKCAGFQNDFDDKYINQEPTEVHKEHFTVAMTTERPTRPPRPAGDRVTRRPIHTADTLLLQQWTDEQNKLDHGTEDESDTDVDNEENETDTETPQPPTRKPLDLSKLEEAIMSINRPGNHLGLGNQRPNFPAAPPGPNGYFPPMYYPPPMPYPSYPYSPYYPGYYQPPAAAPAAAPYSPYYSRSGYRSAKITKGFTDTKIPETSTTIAQITSQQNGTRDSRKMHQKPKQSTAAPSRARTLVPPKDLDVKASMDAMTFHSGSKMRNITCVMQELGYLDEHLEPSYEKMMERITKLQVANELKKDMLDGVKFCKQFSQCVPEIRKDKYQLSKELLRPMFFFRCYKHKKLESCIMKDVRDRFASSSSSAFEDHGTMANELRRSFQKTDLASSVFEFMYGSAADDFDALF